MLLQLKYQIHLFIHSKYKPIFMLSFSFLSIYLLNPNASLDIVYAEEEIKTENYEIPSLGTQLLGVVFFTASVAFVLISHKLNTSIDPTMIIDSYSSNIITQIPECLDNFTLDTVGNLIINNEVELNTENIYLNAETVQNIIQSNHAAFEVQKNAEIERILAPLRKAYIAHNIEGYHLMPSNFLETHTNTFTKLCIEINELQTFNYEHGFFIEALKQIGIIHPELLTTYGEYLNAGNKPEHFYSYLSNLGK